MKFSVTNIPLFFQIYLDIKNNILLKELSPGAQIPTIEELHNHYEVSDGTIRKALELLERDGLIYRRRGLGVFVKEDVDSFLPDPGSSWEELRGAIRSPHIQPISAEWIEPPKRIRAALGGMEDESKEIRVFTIKRLTTGLNDNRIKNLATFFFPAWVLERVDQERLMNSMVSYTLFRLVGSTNVTAEQVLRPWLCDEEGGKYLGLAQGTPIFHKTLIFRSKDHGVMFISETLTTASAFKKAHEIHRVHPPQEPL